MYDTFDKGLSGHELYSTVSADATPLLRTVAHQNSSIRAARDISSH
jgi:hypothetical protein